MTDYDRHASMQESSLRISTLVAIFLRLFAIYWAARALLHFAANFSIYLPTGASAGRQNLAMLLAAPVIYGVMAMLAWIFAEGIAAKVSGRGDPAVPVAQLQRADIYGFGLLLMGLYFFLAHLASSLGGLYGLALGNQTPGMVEEMHRAHLQQLAASLIPCLAGLGVAIASPRLGRKLVRAAAPSAGAAE